MTCIQLSSFGRLHGTYVSWSPQSSHWRLPQRRRECQRQCRGALSRLSMRRAGSSGSLATLCPGQGGPCGRPGWSSRGGRAATGDKEFMKENILPALDETKLYIYLASITDIIC